MQPNERHEENEAHLDIKWYLSTNSRLLYKGTGHRLQAIEKFHGSGLHGDLGTRHLVNALTSHKLASIRRVGSS